ncbi:MAG: helix-turn-helix domain-containing protein [Bacillota bacterium]|jgi:predicted site-specific integrase-resolvase
MEYMTVKEASECWGYSETTIRDWCRKELLSVTYRAEKVSGRWQIPKDAKCPKPLKKNK